MSGIEARHIPIILASSVWMEEATAFPTIIRGSSSVNSAMYSMKIALNVLSTTVIMATGRLQWILQRCSDFSLRQYSTGPTWTESDAILHRLFSSQHPCTVQVLIRLPLVAAVAELGCGCRCE